MLDAKRFDFSVTNAAKVQYSHGNLSNLCVVKAYAIEATNSVNVDLVSNSHGTSVVISGLAVADGALVSMANSGVPVSGALSVRVQSNTGVTSVGTIVVFTQPCY